jgi:hypothetical protein
MFSESKRALVFERIIPFTVLHDKGIKILSWKYVLNLSSSFDCAGMLSEYLTSLWCYRIFLLNLYWYYCRVRREHRSYQIPEFPQIDAEKILCIGSNNKQPVLKWENNMAWPGKLTLTDKAIYFEV